MNFRDVALLSLLTVTPLTAQTLESSPVRLSLRVAEELRVGRPAPAVTLPYATAAGIGPADQPFELHRELGRVVVLAFYPGDFTPGCTAEWRAFRDRAATLFGPEVVVAGISGDSLESHVAFARQLELPFKLLSDAGLRVARRYDAADANRARRVVVVVGRDGLVRYLDRAFAALDPEAYVQLGAAVSAARAE